MKLKAMVDMSLRKSSDPASSLYGEWYEWQVGEIFEPPPHMDVARALARGIAEEVKEDVEAKWPRR